MISFVYVSISIIFMMTGVLFKPEKNFECLVFAMIFMVMASIAILREDQLKIIELLTLMN